MKTDKNVIEFGNSHLITWLVLTFALVIVAYLPIIRTGELGDTGALLQFAPAMSAVLTTLIFNRNLRGLGWKPGPPRLLLRSYGLPILVLTIAYGVVWLATGSFYDVAWVAEGMAELNQALRLDVTSPFLFIVVNGVLTASAGVLYAGIFAIGEEIGWRGFLVPALARRMSFTRVGWVSGLIWSVFHYPVFIFVYAPRVGVSWIYLVAVGTIAGIALSFILAWFRLRSGGFWAAVLFHATVNSFTQGMFENLTIDSGITPYLTGDTGVVTMLGWVVVAFLLWRKRDLLPRRRTDVRSTSAYSREDKEKSV